MHRPDDRQPIDLNRQLDRTVKAESLASLTGWDNEIAFRLQCKQIVKDSGLEGLAAGLATISACFNTAFEVWSEAYEEELKRNGYRRPDAH